MNRLMISLLLCLAAAPTRAAPEPGRLFFTQAQRVQIKQMRATLAAPSSVATPAYIPPVRFDGVVVRSDGRATRWVNGRAQIGAPTTGELKPGQIRADGKVYEPYQVLSLPAGERTP